MIMVNPVCVFGTDDTSIEEELVEMGGIEGDEEDHEEEAF